MNSDDGVPDDFPNPQIAGAVPGSQPKLLLKTWNGKLYAGLTPPERHDRWVVKEDLAQQFIAKLSGPRAEKYLGWAEVAILDQYLTRLIQRTEWGSAEEMQWVIRRIAQVLGWPVPPAAQ